MCGHVRSWPFRTELIVASVQVLVEEKIAATAAAARACQSRDHPAAHLAFGVEQTRRFQTIEGVVLGTDQKNPMLVALHVEKARRARTQHLEVGQDIEGALGERRQGSRAQEPQRRGRDRQRHGDVIVVAYPSSRR